MIKFNRNYIKNLNYISDYFDLDKKTVEIEAGVTMGDLSDFLIKYKRSFPIGLSGKTGMGYILTGGISPLSRSRGLAIDQIMEVKGFWGNPKTGIELTQNFSYY